MKLDQSSVKTDVKLDHHHQNQLDHRGGCEVANWVGKKSDVLGLFIYYFLKGAFLMLVSQNLRSPSLLFLPCSALT